MTDVIRAVTNTAFWKYWYKIEIYFGFLFVQLYSDKSHDIAPGFTRNVSLKNIGN